MLSKEVKDEVVNVKVFNMLNTDVLFEGKVSTDVTPDELLYLRCFCVRGSNSLCDKVTDEKVTSFKGMQNVELIASCIRGGLTKFSSVLYRCDDGVLRSSKTVPSCECAMLMSLWDVSDEECEKVFQCEALEELELNDCRLRQIPNDIGKMKKLKKLILNELKELKSLPEEMGELSCLKELWIENCGIESLPKSIGGLSQLERLDLHLLQHLNTLPESIGQLSNLKVLLINDCGVDSLPKSIGGLRQLEELILQSLYNLQSLPEEIGMLECLKYLYIGFCRIERLPKSVRHLKLLTFLNLRNLSNLQLDPEDVLAFSRLKKLFVQECVKVFQGKVSNAVGQMLRMSVSLRELYFHLLQLKKEEEDILHDAVLENGSIAEGAGDVVSAFFDVFARNRANHARAMSSVVCMMAIRRCRSALNGIPREMIEMLGKMLWITRCDVEAWKTT